ncbi:MAG TPA: hypothetical protein VKL19_12030 [Thermoanaerobaculia bacterium]|nr:hypothetical protein [Thermoanaerobaculia bacterium]
MHGIVLAALMAVDMAAPRLSFMRLKEISAACNSQSDRACTIFREIRLQCNCVKSPEGWRLRSQAQATPYIYTISTSFISHENLHITDVHMSLDALVKNADARAFPSSEACVRYARELVVQFPDAVREFQRETVRLRDVRPLD